MSIYTVLSSVHLSCGHDAVGNVFHVLFRWFLFQQRIFWLVDADTNFRVIVYVDWWCFVIRFSPIINVFFLIIILLMNFITFTIIFSVSLLVSICFIILRHMSDYFVIIFLSLLLKVGAPRLLFPSLLPKCSPSICSKFFSPLNPIYVYKKLTPPLYSAKWNNTITCFAKSLTHALPKDGDSWIKQVPMYSQIAFVRDRRTDGNVRLCNVLDVIVWLVVYRKSCGYWNSRVA